MPERDLSGAGEVLWRVCSKQKLTHAQCYEFLLPLDEMSMTTSLREDAFAINWQGKYYAYQNSCPHTGVGMNWEANQFFDFDSRFLQCGMHGALFEPATGLCVQGPCIAQSLVALPLLVRGDDLYLDCDKLSLL